MIRTKLENVIFSARWMLYPINIGLLIGLSMYIWQFLVEDWHFIFHGKHEDLESMMVVLLGFVDASMVANLVIMIVQGGHQIFIHKFQDREHHDMPQYLDHIDTGILKVKVSMSIASITLVQILKDFVHMETVDWGLAQRRMVIHAMALISSLMMALIWRITNPQKVKEPNEHS